jgi:putative ABC transport system permease protein
MEMLTGSWTDLKRAVRSLAGARAFTFVCVVSLGIGMTPVIAVPYGARMFTATPPGLDTTGLIEVVTEGQGPRRATKLWSYPDFASLREAGTGGSLFGWSGGNVKLLLSPAHGAPTTATALFVSPDYFNVLELPLAMGAGFPDTTEPAVILSHRLWERQLGADPAVVGRTIAVGDVPHVVAGVARAGFGGHLGFHNADLFLALERHPTVLADTAVRFDRSKEWVQIHGRLPAGADMVQAGAVVAAVTAQLAKEHPATNELKAGVVAAYHPLGIMDAGGLTTILAVVQTLTVLPLLVVCLNIAGMVQVRGAMRERELSIRQAIGASRGRLMRQLLAESLVLAVLGAVLASLVLFNVAPLTGWWANEPVPPAMAAALRVDVSMILVVTGLCLVTSLVFGWLPAARFSRPAIITVLKDEGGVGGVRVGRVHRVATALQVAIATPLLVLSAMTLDRVRATATDDLGFDAELVYAAPLTLDEVTADTAWSRVEGARDALARTAGVTAVTITDGLPLDFRYRITRVATQPDASAAPKIVAAHVTRIGDGYFETTGIDLLRGRSFDADDRSGAASVAILSKPLAEQLFPGEDPLGRILTFAPGDPLERMLTIVGVSSDFPTSQMSTSRAQLLLPLAQYPDVLRDSVNVDDDRGSAARLMLVARGEPGAQPNAMTAALSDVVRDLDSEFEAAQIVTGAWLRRNSVNDFLTQSAVAGVVGGILLTLAALGIYGVVGLMVATRTREIAVRIAIGASPRRVIGMVLTDVVKLVLPGVGIGLLLAVAFVKLNGEDFGIALSSLEPLAYLLGSAIAILIALAAGLAPARRAASVEPMVAMRTE